MTPERYRQIGELYHAALELPAEERTAFLERECAGDSGLRLEVESLIRSNEGASDFITSPAFAVAAELFAVQETDALIGQTIGRYKVLSLLGMGGMGRVYLAEDTALGRRVALKLLPDYFTNDKTQVQRFRQEARAASALNHPNILTVHEVGQLNTTEFIATEYVEGETLRARLTCEPLAVTDAIDVAAQVAEALVAAHAAGIIHRDIKPENVMLRTDGYVKVLDFGLAKLTENLSGLQSVNAETPTRPFIKTHPGMLMGTAEYMSPEQARGLPVDGRTDIWSLGVVLYEMLTGVRPFSRATHGDIIVAVLEREPSPLSQQAPGIPAELEQIVTKALAKNTNERYQTVKDMAVDLRRLRRRLDVEAELGRSPMPEADSEATTRVQTPVSATREQGVSRAGQVSAAAPTSSLEFAVSEIRRHKTGFALAGIILIAALGAAAFGFYKFFGRAKTAGTNAPLRITPLTTLPSAERSPAFSPDGKQVAFVWTSEKLNFDVYVKLIGAGEPLRLTTNPARDMSPAWSPDGRYIAFLRGTGEARGYYVIPALGGVERKLTDAYGWEHRGVMNQAVAWSPDGRTLAIVDKTAEEEPWCIFLLSIETGERRKFMTPPAKTDGDTTVAFSPDGRTLAFVRSHNLVGDIYFAPGDIYLAPLAGGDPVRLTSDETITEGLAWVPDGSEIVFSSMRGGGSRPTLWRIPAAGGTPAPVVGPGEGVLDLSISSHGDQLAYSQISYDFDIYRVEITAQSSGHPKMGPPMNLISSTRTESDPQFSPDGQRLAFISNRSGKSNLWVCDANGKNLAQLTDGLYLDTPRWSPDARLIAFSSLVGGNSDIYTIGADGGVVRRLTTDPSAETTPSWSPDGSWLYFSSNRTGRAEVWKMATAGGATVQLTHSGGFDPLPAPDGHKVYYLRDEKDPWLWSVSTDGGAEALVLENPEPGKWMEPANWAVGAHGIYFLEAKRGYGFTLKFLDFETRRTTPLTTWEIGSRGFAMIGLTVAPDEHSILYAISQNFGVDLMLVENFR